MTYASVKMNQRAEIVAISRTLAIYTERKAAREKGKYAAIEPAHVQRGGPGPHRSGLRRRGATGRGAALLRGRARRVTCCARPWPKGPLTTTDMIVFHAGGYGFVP